MKTIDAMPAKPSGPRPIKGPLTAEERTAAMAEMYDAGETFHTIGVRFDVSRERVRQLLRPTGRRGWRPRSSLASSAAELEKLRLAGEWLQDQGIMTWAKFTEETGLTREEYQYGVIKGVIPRNFVLARANCKPPTYTLEDAVAAVAAAYARSGHTITKKDKTFSGDMYEKWKLPADPSQVLISMRWRWADIAEAAGVPTKRRELRRKIDADGMIASIAVYLKETLDAGKKPSGNDYHAWSKSRTDCYSFSAVRLVLRRENMTWQEAVLTASEMINT